MTIPPSVVHSFGEVLKASVCLTKLEWHNVFISRSFHMLMEGIIDPLRSNKSLRQLTLSFYVEVVHDGIRQKFVAFWNALGAALRLTNLEVLAIEMNGLTQAFPTTRELCQCLRGNNFVSLAWENGSLESTKVVLRPWVGAARVQGFSRLTLRNKLLKSARDFALLETSDSTAALFLSELVHINQVEHSPRDIHDVTISALYELTRKGLPHLIDLLNEDSPYREGRIARLRKHFRTQGEPRIARSCNPFTSINQVVKECCLMDGPLFPDVEDESLMGDMELGVVRD